FTFDYNKKNDINDINDNILLIRLTSTNINNTTKNNKNNNFDLQNFTNNIFNPLTYKEGAIEIIAKELIDLFSNNLSNNIGIQQYFLTSRRINFIISHDEDLPIRKFLITKKNIYLDDYKQFPVKENKRQYKKSEEERKLEGIIDSLDKLDIQEDKEKYENFNIAFQIKNNFEEIKNIIDSKLGNSEELNNSISNLFNDICQELDDSSEIDVKMVEDL
ncbi:14185_t:CDS:2, partial [Cetraspora pellucida]